MRLLTISCLVAAAGVAIVMILQPEACVGDPVSSCKPVNELDIYWWIIATLVLVAVILFAISRRRSSQ